MKNNNFIVFDYFTFIKNQVIKYDFNNYYYAIARTLLGIGTLFSIGLNNPNMLFNPTNIENPNHELIPFNKLSVFYLLSDNLILAKWLSIIILLLVIFGYKPRYTCIPHWWITFSFATSCFVIEGGDHISQILTLLIIPICLCDNRNNHWILSQTNNFINSSFSFFSFIFIRLQVCFIYLQTSIGKLKVDEWKDGTVLYYWFNNSFIGTANEFKPIVNFITSSPTLLTLSTWSSMIVEFLLFMCISSFEKHRKYFLWVGLLFHLFIFIFFGLFSFMFAMSAALILYLGNFKKTTS